jgi:hypothetical protein
MLSSPAAMFLWVFGALLSFGSSALGAELETIRGFQCSVLPDGIELNDDAANAYVELRLAQESYSGRTHHVLSAHSAVKLFREQNQSLSNAIGAIQANRSIWLNRKWDSAQLSDGEPSSYDDNARNFLSAVFRIIIKDVSTLLKEPFYANPTWNDALKRHRLGLLFIQSIIQPVEEFFENGDINIEEVAEQTRLLEFDEAVHYAAKEIVLGRLAKEGISDSRYNSGVMISTTKESSIFEKNQLLPLPVLVLDFSGDVFHSHDGLEQQIRQWKQIMSFYDSKHSNQDRIKLRAFGDALNIQRLYQRTRAAATDDRTRAEIDWVFHSIRLRPDENYALGLDGMIQLIGRIGDQTPEQINFTNLLMPKLRSKEALGPDTTLEQVLKARDALLIHFTAALH